MREHLDPPHSIENAEKSMELVRVWLVDGKPNFCITKNLWDDPSAWGLLLADLANHISKAYEHFEGEDSQVVLARIVELLFVELEYPTDKLEDKSSEGTASE